MYRVIGKRALDLVAALVAFPFVALIGMVVGAAIKAEDGGPVFYTGSRLGRGQVPFRMYKFRSMICDAPDIRNPDGSTFSSPSDARLTRVGRIIRATSIDELPQILNVVRGDMSLVGPRPSPLGNEGTYTTQFTQRFVVKPGITGLAQVILRNSGTMEDRSRLDNYYVANLSFRLDYAVVARTIGRVLSRQSLYRDRLPS